MLGKLYFLYSDLGGLLYGCSDGRKVYTMSLLTRTYNVTLTVLLIMCSRYLWSVPGALLSCNPIRSWHLMTQNASSQILSNSEPRLWGMICEASLNLTLAAIHTQRVSRSSNSSQKVLTSLRTNFQRYVRPGLDIFNVNRGTFLLWINRISRFRVHIAESVRRKHTWFCNVSDSSTSRLSPVEYC